VPATPDSRSGLGVRATTPPWVWTAAGALFAFGVIPGFRRYGEFRVMTPQVGVSMMSVLLLGVTILVWRRSRVLLQESGPAGRPATVGRFALALAFGLLLGAYAAEMTLLADDFAFMVEVEARGSDKPCQRGRREPWRGAELQYAPERGYWAND
jgi:hypothetical protein